MLNQIIPKMDPTQTGVYQIRIKGHLGHHWKDWFEDMSVSLGDNGDTLITGPVPDLAALYGLLKKVRDMGAPLVSINPVKSGRAKVSAFKLPTAIHQNE